MRVGRDLFQPVGLLLDIADRPVDRFEVDLLPLALDGTANGERAGDGESSEEKRVGAFFMATDMVTSPITKKGMIIFAIGCGVLTSIIRLYGGYPEGVCYSILLMNTATPLIDRFTKPKIFGERKENAK